MDMYKFLDSLTTTELISLQTAMASKAPPIDKNEFDLNEYEKECCRTPNRKIEAIKSYRSRVGCDLLMAKRAIDRHVGQQNTL